MILEELLSALGLLGDGDWRIVDIRTVEEAGGSGGPGAGAAPSGGRRLPTIMPRRPQRRLRKIADKLVVEIRLRIN